MRTHGSTGTTTLPAPRSTAASPTTPLAGVTVFGCSPDEVTAVHAVAPRLGVRPTTTAEPVAEATAHLARGHRCVSVGHGTPVTHRTLLALRRAGVEYVSTRSIGYDHVDLASAERLGLRVGNVCYEPDGVADFTVMLLLMAVRGARATLRRVDDHDYRLGGAPARELRDLTVGVVGTGRIGAAVVRRLRGFGCRVLTHDVRPRGGVRGATAVTLDQLLGASDVVTLHTPLTAETHHLLDADRIARLKAGAVVVNTGRGALVDTAALLASLESGRLGGAALDVVEGEAGIFYGDHRVGDLAHPLLERLQRLPNVVVTPHTAFHTDRAVTAMVEDSLGSCAAFARSRRA